MPTITEIYHYRVQRWQMPIRAPWLPQKYRLARTSLRSNKPEIGRGIAPTATMRVNGPRTTWEWTDSARTPIRVVAIKLAKPVEQTVSYQDL